MHEANNIIIVMQIRGLSINKTHPGESFAYKI